MGSRALRRAELLLVVALTLAARTSTGEERQRRFRIGPVYFSPRLLFTAGPDSNVYHTEDNAVRDNTLLLGPRLDLTLPVGRRLLLTGRGGVDLNYFEREESERSTDYQGTGEAQLLVGPLTLAGGRGGGRSRQRFSTEIDRRLERRFDEIHALASFAFTRKIQLSAGANELTTTHQEGVVLGGVDVRDALDRRTRKYSAQLRVALTSRTTVLASGETQNDLFLNDPANAPREARSRRYAGGFEFSPRAFVRGSVVAGIRDFPDEDEQVVPPFNGVIASANIQAPLRHIGQLTLTAGRDVYYAVERVIAAGQALRNSYVSGSYGGGLTVELPLSLLARGNVSFDRADYLLPYQIDGRELDRLDRVRTTGVTLLRAFGRPLRVGVTVQWSRRESNVPGFSYRATLYGLAGEFAP